MWDRNSGCLNLPVAYAIAGAALLVLAAFAGNSLAEPLIDLSAGIHRIEAEVAADSPTRGLGLMNRRQMDPRRGMLFVFAETGVQCMWMRNTLIPLSVAFIDEHGVIINIEDMQPQTDNTHCAAKPARFALEMNRGWFQAHGVVKGARIRGLEKAPPGR